MIPVSRPSLLRWVRVSAVAPLALLVAASVVLRTAVGALKSTPIYFTDEYLYAELGRSLAATGRPLVRGASPHFPALLQPVLTAPAWLLGDIATGYAAVKVEGALAMSLAAVPVYLLASRLGLRRSTALLTATVAIVLPEMLYASWILAEPYAYPLALGAVATGSVALGGGGRRSRVAFLLLATAAILARVQLIALPLCFAAATLIVGLRRRDLLAAVRQQRLVLFGFVLPLVAVLLLAPHRILGVYGAFSQVDLGLGGLADRLGANGFVFLFAAGWVVVPGALFGLWLAVARPRSDIELAFGALVGALALVLFAPGQPLRRPRSSAGAIRLLSDPVGGAPLLPLCVTGLASCPCVCAARGLRTRALRDHSPVGLRRRQREVAVGLPLWRLSSGAAARHRSGCLDGGARRDSRIRAGCSYCREHESAERRSASP